MRLSNRKSVITSLPEGEPPKNFMSKVTQWIYLLAVISLLVYIIYLLVKPSFLFNETGLVEVERIKLSSVIAGPISSLKVKESDLLKAGQTIAVVQNTSSCIVKQDRRIDELKHDIGLDTAELKGLRKQLDQAKKAKSSNDLKRPLELGRGIIGNNDRLTRQIQDLVIDIETLTSRIKLRRNHLETLQDQQKEMELPARCLDASISAPLSAKVDTIHIKENEFVERGETVLTIIPEKAKVSIEVYLDTDQLAYIHPGYIFGLQFPDGIASQGKVENISSTAKAFSEREWNDYEAIEPRLKVTLLPVKQEDAALWSKYDRLPVNVNGKKASNSTTNSKTQAQ